MIINQYSLKKALCTLFGAELLYSQSTVNTIKIDAVKETFRNKVKLMHPDRSKVLGISEKRLTYRFQQLNEAYSYLNSVLKSGKQIVQKRKIQPGNRSNQNFNFDDIRSRRYFQGSIPKRELRFAEFLYYRKIIDWRTLIQAIVWQKRTRPLLGKIALDLNYLNDSSIDRILQNRIRHEKFGEAALRQEFINLYQLYVILGRQKSYKCPIGHFFWEKNILSKVRVLKYLQQNKQYNDSMRYNKGHS